MVLLNVYHQLEQRFWYDDVQISKFGAAGTSRQMFNDVSIDRSGGNGGGGN
ncbi:hypothetical protein [Halorussus ruber]|uniref:hypothetical protein n=1 Tax=Halorussus ruber TaxID=1126238 RepID=UPI00143D53A0|nr:hypothetical protein [Halorussus ruber]